MRFPQLISLFLLFLTASGLAQIKSDKNQTGSFYTFEIEDAHENMDGYNVYIPKACEDKDGGCPVLIFLQGGLGVGGEIDVIYDWALPKMLKDGSTGNAELDQLRLETFIVVMPHIESGQFYQYQESLSFVIEEVNRQFNTDRDAYFLTGLSRGGHGTWGIADDMTRTFKAIVPICGGTHGIEGYNYLPQIPIWVIHNTEDGIVSYRRSVQAVENIEALGVNFYRNEAVAGTPIAEYDHIFTSPEEESHDAWTATYSSVEFYRWLLKYVSN